MVTVKCKLCKNEFSARVADRKRGWARFCSKSCKAVKQERKNGQHRAYLQGRGVSNLNLNSFIDFRDDEIDISDADFGASDGGCLKGYE